MSKAETAGTLERHGLVLESNRSPVPANHERAVRASVSEIRPAVLVKNLTVIARDKVLVDAQVIVASSAKPQPKGFYLKREAPQCGTPPASCLSAALDLFSLRFRPLGHR